MVVGRVRCVEPTPTDWANEKTYISSILQDRYHTIPSHPISRSLGQRMRSRTRVLVPIRTYLRVWRFLKYAPLRDLRA